MRKLIALTLLALALAGGAVALYGVGTATPAAAALCHGGGCPRK